MTDQIPRGPKDLYCPTWRKPRVKVCHTCPLWMKITGTDPQSGLSYDRWNCSMFWSTYLQIESSQRINQVGAAVESARNEAMKSADTTAQILAATLIETNRVRESLGDIYSEAQSQAITNRQRKQLT